MLVHHPPRLFRARLRSILRSAAGAFDLPSIITGVVVVGVLTAGVLATIFGIIPFAQENGAKQDLAAVRTAEGVALAKDGKFMTTDELYTAGYLTGQFTTAQGGAGESASGFERAAAVTTQRSIAVQVGPNKNCYVGVSRANTGKVFYLTDQSAEAKLLEPTTVTGCIDKDTLVGLTDAIGATTPEMKLPPADVIKAGATPVTFYGSAFGDKTVMEGTTVVTRYDFRLQGFSDTTHHDVTWTGTNLKAINATTITPGTTGTNWFANVAAAPEGLTPGTGYVTATITNKGTGETTVQSWKLTVSPKTVQASGDYRYTTSYRDVSVPAWTSTTVRFVGGVSAGSSAPVPAGRYKAEWSGADAANATITASELANSGYQEQLFIGDIVAKPGGFKPGVSTLTLKLTNTVTGAVTSHDFKLTVTPQADAAMAPVYYAALEHYAQTLSFNLPNAAPGDFTTTWSIDGDINATMVATAAGPTAFSGAVTPKAGDLYPGTAKVTATVKHVAGGETFKRTWDVTVGQIVWGDSSQYSNRFGDRTTYEMGAGVINFAFGIPKANYTPGAFDVTWTGGTGLNTTATPVAESAYGSTMNWGLNVTPKSGGFTAGTDTITVTAKHRATGFVLTKTLKLTASPVKLEAGTKSPANSTTWADRTITASSTTPVVFGFGVPSSFPATGYTVSWAGLEGANVISTPTSVGYDIGDDNYANSFAPAAGGYKAGTYTLTATVTNKFTGSTTTKTWTLTVKP